MILPLPMAIDATACLACRCGRAKQRLPKMSVHPVVVAPRARGARDHVAKLVRRLSPARHRNTLPVMLRPKTPYRQSIPEP